ncbi:peptide transporter PTR2, partial [Trifolium medium]|nr:peptide transporter PTR2 [Trifolium medium]
GNFYPTDESKVLLNAAKSKGPFHSKSSTRVCTFCGKDNHIVENCFKKHGLPPHLRKSSTAHNAAIEGGSDEQTAIASDNTHGQLITQDQAAQLISLLQNSFPSQSPSTATSNQVGSVNFIDHPSVNQGKHSHIFQACSLGNWIIDSGASHHMCNSIQWLHSYSEIIPIKEQLTKKMIGSGDMVDGLYYLRLADKGVHAYTTNGNYKTTIPDQALWHFRLGHISLSRMQFLQSQFSFIKVDNKGVCDICHLARHKKLPYNNSMNKAAISYEMLHFDIWGPIATKSLHNHSYFLTAVDDYSSFMLQRELFTKLLVLNPLSKMGE